MACSNDLIARAQSGDRDAQLQILDAHEGLILRVASRCVGPLGRITEDMLQEARLAVLLAIVKYDPSRKTAFSTLAWCVIRNRLDKLLRSESRNSFVAMPPE